MVAGLLRPGGCFFDLDLMLDVAFVPAGSTLGELYARGVPRHYPNPDVDSHHHHHHHHQLPANVVVPTLEDHLRWLRYGAADCP